MGNSCPSRNNQKSAESVFANKMSEATQPVNRPHKFRDEPTQKRKDVIAKKDFRADAQPFVPCDDNDSYLVDEEIKTNLMPWERFLEDKKLEASRPNRLNRDMKGSYTSGYRQLLKEQPSNNRRQNNSHRENNDRIPWATKDSSSFDPVESWRSMPQKTQEAPAAKKKKQTPLKKAILQHSGGTESMFEKFNEHLVKAQNLRKDGDVSKLAEQIDRLEKRSHHDDIAIKSDLVPFGLSDRHYFSADEDAVKSNKHNKHSQVVAREYVTMAMTPALENSVTALLYKLRHIKVAELSCGTESKRYAVGLREVARLLRGDQAAALIVAPDVERNSGGMLEQKIAGLVETCKNNGIPVVYALSRRQLGHAVMKNVAISVMLVQSTRGAEKEFTSVIEESEAAQKLWDQKTRAPPGL